MTRETAFLAIRRYARDRNMPIDQVARRSSLATQFSATGRAHRIAPALVDCESHLSHLDRLPDMPRWGCVIRHPGWLLDSRCRAGWAALGRDRPVAAGGV